MSRVAPFPTALIAQIRAEARLTSRRGENLLAMVGIPAAALVFFGQLPATRDSWTLVPAILGLAIVASGLVNLGISTAYERGYGVLKRLGGSPLGREGLLAAKLVVIGAIAVAQVAALIALAAIFDTVPGGASWPALLVTTLVGAGTFAAIGLLLAGAVRPDAALVLANALFLVAILLGGMVVPLGQLPEPLGTIARVLPFGALAEAFSASLGHGGEWPGSLGLVVVWGAAAALTTIRTFQWE